MNKLAFISDNAHYYKTRFLQETNLQKAFTLIYSGTSPSRFELTQLDVILGDPSLVAKHLQKCPNLKWIQSSWAGNNALQKARIGDYKLTGIKDVFGQQMFEYILTYLLFFAKRVPDFQSYKKQQQWNQPECIGLQNLHVGIMGMGNIGKHVATHLLRLGLKVSGLCNTTKHIDHLIEYRPTELPDFLQHCDFIVNILPETEQTKGMCNTTFFNMMKKNSVFINVGRGSVIDQPNSLINALDKGPLKAAVIDVFEQEPLSSDHPYYQIENIYITCHTAAVSQPPDVYDVFRKNAQRFVNNDALLYRHDFSKGY